SPVDRLERQLAAPDLVLQMIGVLLHRPAHQAVSRTQLMIGCDLSADAFIISQQALVGHVLEIRHRPLRNATPRAVDYDAARADRLYRMLIVRFRGDIRSTSGRWRQ